MLPFFTPRKQLLKKINWTFPVVPCFTWKLEFISNILSVIVFGNSFFASNSPQAPLNLICFTILVTLRPLTLF